MTKKKARKPSLTPYSAMARSLHEQLREGFRSIRHPQKVGMALGLSVKGEPGRNVTASYSFKWMGVPEGVDLDAALNVLIILIETVAKRLDELPSISVDWKDRDKSMVSVRMDW